MSTLIQETRLAARRLLQSPGFSAVALLTVALGIGANTAIFSVVDAVLLRPLPYADAERLAMIWRFDEEGGTTWLSRQEVVGYRSASRAFDDVAAYTDLSANLTGGAEPERVPAARVTTNAFGVLGVRPLLGRAFQEEDAARADEVVLLSHALWRRRFGADPGVVGREVQVDGRARTVVGVMPPDFRLPLDYRQERPTELWVPLALDPANLGGWGDRSFLGFGRLRPGVPPRAASRDLERVAAGWVEQGFLRDNGDGRLQRSAVPVRELVSGEVRPALLVLLGAVGFVLLIACANVANLLLARADRRRREMAIRAALGASRGRMLLQLLAESLLLAVLGGALGLGLAEAGLRLLVALDPASVPRLEEVGLNPRVLAFTAAVAALTGVLFGLVPAVRASRPDLRSDLAQGGRGTSVGGAGRGLRRGLVVAEVALSVVLVVGAGLLIRSFQELRRVELGFRPERVLTLRLALPQAGYPEPDEVSAFYRRLVEEVRELPGVESAGAGRLLPLTGTIGDWSITLEGRPARPGENPNGDWQVVTPGYLEALGATLVRGRFLEPGDDADGPLSAVVNETMAERYWPGEDPLGKRFHLGTQDQPWVSIVGVVRPVRHNAVVEEPRAEMYLSHAQFPLETGNAVRGMTLVVRSAADPLTLLGPVREVIRGLDPDLPVSEVRTLEEVVSRALAQERFTMLLLAIFAGVALALAAVGIYGVVALLVAQRTHEIGIRMALGAERRTILGLVLGQGMALGGAGIVVGVAGAALLARSLRALVYGVPVLDVPTFLVVPLVLAATTLLACYLPARRALRVDPIEALRAE